MKIDEIISQLNKNNMKYFIEDKEWLNTDDTRIVIHFNKNSKSILLIQYFFNRREKQIEQKIVN